MQEDCWPSALFSDDISWLNFTLSSLIVTRIIRARLASIVRIRARQRSWPDPRRTAEREPIPFPAGVDGGAGRLERGCRQRRMSRGVGDDMIGNEAGFPALQLLHRLDIAELDQPFVAAERGKRLPGFRLRGSSNTAPAKYSVAATRPLDATRPSDDGRAAWTGGADRSSTVSRSVASAARGVAIGASRLSGGATMTTSTADGGALAVM